MSVLKVFIYVAVAKIYILLKRQYANLGVYFPFGCI